MKSISTTQSYPCITSASDVELVEAVSRDRSQNALEELYRRHRPVLRSVIHRVMNSDADTDDVLQDVYIQLWNQAGSYSAKKGQLLGWLITVARRRALDRVRQNCAYRNATDRYEKTMAKPEMLQQEASSVDREVWKHELRDRMSGLLQKLPEAQRDAVRLTYYQGLSQREIAARLAVPLGTIKTRIELGMRKLGRSLMWEAA